MLDAGKVDRLSNPPGGLAEFYEWFREMRDTLPVGRDERGVWHVFRYADVVRVLSEPKVFSSDLRALVPAQEDFDRFIPGNFVSMDPPEHGKLRKLVSQAFNPRMVEGLAPSVDAIVEDLMEDVRQSDQIDLIRQLASPLPVMVIADMVGIPRTDVGLFRAWAGALLGAAGDQPSDMPDDGMMSNIAPTLRDMHAYLTAHVEDRQRTPAHDLTSNLAMAEVDGQRLRDEEIVGIIAMLLLAGHVTTTATIANTVVSLHRNPDALVRVRAEPDLLNDAVDESVRYMSPFPRQTRLVSADVQIGGQTVPAGSPIHAWIGSANRDETVFKNPDAFDIGRAPNPHLGFGRGIHYCLGAPLAMLEVRSALAALLHETRQVAIDDGVGLKFHDARLMTGIKSAVLNVEWR